MKLNRRQMLATLGGMAVLGRSSFAFAKTKIEVGSNEVISISDGHLLLPRSMLFDGLPQTPLEEILSKHGISSDQLMRPCNLTLLRQDENLVLFDAGSGAGFMPSAGDMLENLGQEDVSAEDITHVVFTHGHPDHLWGILDDFDDPVFPNAEILIGQTEWDYWTDPETVSTIGDARASFAVGAARRLEAIEDQISFFKDADEILPGVMAHGTPGHTPGHMSFEVRNGSDAVMIGGDAIGNHHVSFARPKWHSGADQDPEMGAASRVRLLDKLATDKTTLLGFHLPDGGLGQVERDGDAYRFVPNIT